MHKTWTPVLSSAGTVVTSLLSCAACPACLPLYAGILSLLGVELFEVNVYFFPLMLVFLGLTLAFMFSQVMRKKADSRPFWAAFTASGAVVWGATLGNEYILYTSLAAFMGSVFWNKSLLKKKVCKGCCTKSS